MQITNTASVLISDFEAFGSSGYYLSNLDQILFMTSQSFVLFPVGCGQIKIYNIRTKNQYFLYLSMRLNFVPLTFRALTMGRNHIALTPGDGHRNRQFDPPGPCHFCVNCLLVTLLDMGW